MISNKENYVKLYFPLNPELRTRMVEVAVWVKI